MTPLFIGALPTKSILRIGVGSLEITPVPVSSGIGVKRLLNRIVYATVGDRKHGC